MEEIKRGPELGSWWIINVSTYGSFAFWGTRAEAASRMEAKRMWEGAERGSFRLATKSKHDETLKKIAR